jgi:hypothetical protein
MMKFENRNSRRSMARRFALLVAWFVLATAFVGCTSMPEPDNRPRTASDFIGQPRPMP